MYASQRYICLMLASIVALSSCNPGWQDPGRVQAAAAPRWEESREVLNRILRLTQNSVPDVVLNNTKCLLVFPAAFIGTNSTDSGIASCRETRDRWGSPAVATFSGRVNSPRVGRVSSPRAQEMTGDLLVFLMTDRAMRALRSGKFTLSPASTVAGPVVRQAAVFASSELQRDAFAYRYLPFRGDLAGTPIRGEVSIAAENRSASSQKETSQNGDQAARFGSSLASFFNSIVPTGIIIHHTASIPSSGKVPSSEKQVDEYHQERGFEIQCLGKIYHVAYHYLVLPNGKVQTGRPERCQGAHALGYNSYLGISIVGDFSTADNPLGSKGLEAPTAKQMEALLRLCLQLRARYNIPIQHVLRHSDVSATLCPGDRFPFERFLRALESGH